MCRRRKPEAYASFVNKRASNQSIARLEKYMSKKQIVINDLILLILTILVVILHQCIVYWWNNQTIGILFRLLFLIVCCITCNASMKNLFLCNQLSKKERIIYSDLPIGVYYVTFCVVIIDLFKCFFRSL